MRISGRPLTGTPRRSPTCIKTRRGGRAPWGWTSARTCGSAGSATSAGTTTPATTASRSRRSTAPPATTWNCATRWRVRTASRAPPRTQRSIISPPRRARRRGRAAGSCSRPRWASAATWRSSRSSAGRRPTWTRSPCCSHPRGSGSHATDGGLCFRGRRRPAPRAMTSSAGCAARRRGRPSRPASRNRRMRTSRTRRWRRRPTSTAWWRGTTKGRRLRARSCPSSTTASVTEPACRGRCGGPMRGRPTGSTRRGTSSRWEWVSSMSPGPPTRISCRAWRPARATCGTAR